VKPDYAAAYFNRGVVWMAMREYDRAIADFEKAAELDPSRKAAAAEKIRICLSKKK
jgi:tetratricopeptide (TPR) repeat protein